MRDVKEEIRACALNAGFIRARILAPFAPEPPPEEPRTPDNRRCGMPSALIAALPYGNLPLEGDPPAAGDPPPGTGSIAPFARRNYYREAVRRLQALAAEFRARYGGTRADYAIFCNSPFPEKPLARACGLGEAGRNSLIITPEAGSLVIIAGMTLPLALKPDTPLTQDESFFFCGACDPEHPPCKAACPTNAVRGDGTIERERCIQWYASGNGATVPPEVVRHWGRRLYGCTACQDACVRNRRPIPGTRTSEGMLPAYLDCRELLAASDEELKARFKGTALGLSWPGPQGIRRTARLAGRCPDPAGFFLLPAGQSPRRGDGAEPREVRRCRTPVS
ncbi:MAG: iron-sulfur protein [Treponema sp.]|nr:iron-sulfur protein [Treponema sp.]